jgi:hypothetical protein
MAAKTTMREQLAPFMTRGEDGKLSLSKSVFKFTEAARAEIAKQNADDNLIKETASKLFTDFKGATIGASGLASMIVREWEKTDPAMGHPDIFGALSKRIIAIMDEDTGDGKTYGTRKGPHAGYFRHCDQTPTKP